MVAAGFIFTPCDAPAGCLLCEYGERTAAAADPGSPLTVRCHAEGPVVEDRPLVWIAEVEGGSGEYSYEWTHRRALAGQGVPFSPFGGDAPVVAERLESEARLARVRVTDLATGQAATSEACYMHVLPSRHAPPFSTPPNVTPVVWLPRGEVLDAESIAEIERAWRGIRAGFWHQYGRTFRMNPLQVVSSAFSEQDICGHPDCSTIRKTGEVVSRANEDVDHHVGSWVPYTNARMILAWGAGAHAGSPGWDVPRGAVGDVAAAAIAGVQTPPVEPNLHDGVARRVLGDYVAGLAGAIAHELNHAIGSDDPHDHNLFKPVNEREKEITLAGPFLTEALADPVPPEGRITAPSPGAVLSGFTTVRVEASDGNGVDAVVFLLDNQFLGSDTAPPYEITFDTTAVGFGRHVIRTMTYDLAGNITSDSVEFNVHNVVLEAECGESYPQGGFHACLFAGTDLDPADYLTTLQDNPFPVPASNAWHLVNHSWITGEEIAAGRSTHVSGVWTGTIDFPADTYIVKVESSRGVRIYAGDSLVLDRWTNSSHGGVRVPLELAGPTPIRIEWFQTDGASRLQVFVQPFTFDPLFFDMPTLELHSSPVLPFGPALVVDPGDEVAFELDSKIDGDAHPPTLAAQDRVRGTLPIRVSRRGIPEGKERWTAVWQPQLRDQGQIFEIDLRLADYFGNTAEVGTFPLRVRIVELPSFESLSERHRAAEGRLMRFHVRAVNVDGAPIAYSAENLPGSSVFRPRGDANLDGLLNAADLNAIALLNGTPVTASHLVPADANGDGVIDTMDWELALILLFQPISYELAWLPEYHDATGMPVEVQFAATDPRGTTYRTVAIDVRNMPLLHELPSAAGIAGEPLSFVARVEDDLEEVMAFAHAAGSTIVTAPYFGPMGDTTLDRRIAYEDVELANSFAVGERLPTDLERRVGDINGNGEVDFEDVWSIFLYYLKLEQPRFLYYLVPAGEDPGSHEVLIIAQNSATRGTVHRSARVIVLAEPVLHGRVSTPSAAPVPGATVELRTIEPDGRGRRQIQLTRSDGSFAFHGSGAASGRLRAKLRGFRMEPRSYRNAPLGSPEPVLFIATDRTGGTSTPATGSNTIAGRVALPDGSPLPGAEIRLRSRGGPRVLVRVVTGGEGEYALFGLPDGEYAFAVKRRGHKFPRTHTITLAGGEVRVVDTNALQ